MQDSFVLDWGRGVKASGVSPAEAGLFSEQTAEKEGTGYHS
jgi:hypothetical protein